MPELPSVTAKAVARQVLKTWWFWLGLAVIIWSGLLGVEKLTRLQTNRFQGELARDASNQLARSILTISNAIREQVTQNVSNQLARELTNGLTDVSNQIATALQQPRVQAAIQAAAAQQATQVMFKAISPAIANFQARLAQAQTQALALTNARPPAVASKPPPPKDAAKPAPPSTPDTPAGILYDSQTVAKQGATYVVTVRFKKTGTRPLGIMHFALGAYNQLSARIVGVDAINDSAFGVEKSIDTSGLEAALNFSVPDGSGPVIQVLLSGPTILQVVCDALSEPVTLRAMTLDQPVVPAQ